MRQCKDQSSFHAGIEQLGICSHNALLFLSQVMSWRRAEPTASGSGPGQPPSIMAGRGRLCFADAGVNTRRAKNGIVAPSAVSASTRQDATWTGLLISAVVTEPIVDYSEET